MELIELNVVMDDRIAPERSAARIASRLEAQLKKLLSMLHIADAQWSIAIVGDQQMKALHKQTMNLSSTTDVLTFDMREKRKRPMKDREGDRVELDSVLCWDEAQRRAVELGHDISHELLLYALHSLLHVQGYEDCTPARYRRMHGREDELLSAIGVGRVFAGGVRETRRRPKDAPKRIAKKITKKREGSSAR